MNWLDLILIITLALFIRLGWRQGFFIAFADLTALLVILLTTTIGYPLTAYLLREIGFTTTWANFLGFFVLLIIASKAWHSLAHKWSESRKPHSEPSFRLAGGFITLIEGFIISVVVLATLTFFPISPLLESSVNRSALASTMVDEAGFLEPSMHKALGGVVDRGLVVLKRRSKLSKQGIPKVDEYRIDKDAEKKMLALVNRERLQRGLRELQMNPVLQEAARKHAKEMFRLGYFDHESPNTGSPLDRIRKLNLTFSIMGENLAYAPTLQIAHRGLMDSPSHKENLLFPSYRQAGIGVVSAGLYGRMFVQEFSD